MNLVRCANGHFYDADIFSVCPHCLDENKPPKIFISHAEKDKKYIKLFVELLEFIGIQSNQLFCSSSPGYDVPEGKNIYDYLQEQFNKYQLHIFYMLSSNYYQSAASLNEMGAGWILRMKYTTILLPGFEYEKIKGAVDPCIISAKLDGNRYQVRSKLKQIKTKLEEEFGLTPKPEERWDEKLDEFIEAVNRIAAEEITNHEIADEHTDIEDAQPVKQEESASAVKEPFIGTGITKQELLMPDDQKALLDFIEPITRLDETGVNVSMDDLRYTLSIDESGYCHKGKIILYTVSFHGSKIHSIFKDKIFEWNRCDACAIHFLNAFDLGFFSDACDALMQAIGNDDINLLESYSLSDEPNPAICKLLLICHYSEYDYTEAGPIGKAFGDLISSIKSFEEDTG